MNLMGPEGERITSTEIMTILLFLALKLDILLNLR
jgi:hypothetical protein